MRRWLLIVLAVGLPAVALLAAQPGEDPAPVPDVATQLAELNATLHQIAGLLERQATGQDLDLVMKRVQLTADRADQIEAELRRAEGERMGLEDEGRRMDLRLEGARSEMEASGAEPEQIEAVARQLAGEMEILDARLKDVRGRVAELEQRLAEERGAQREWQEFLDRMLGQL